MRASRMGQKPLEMGVAWDKSKSHGMKPLGMRAAWDESKSLGMRASRLGQEQVASDGKHLG